MATPSRKFFSAPPDAAPLLRLEDLSVHFPFEGCLLPAVRDVHLELPPAAITCLVGESGCGKSLTARAVLRLTPETAVLGGRALLRGEDLLSLPEKELRGIRGRRVGMIFQEPMTSLNPVLRVGEQVAEPLRLHLGMGRAEARREAERLFADVGIPSPHSRYDDYPHQLSGGMRQRVMIAMALACRPELLLADEPTTALDATIQGQILRLILDQSRERGMAVLLITHDLGVVAEVADVVGVMYAGRSVNAPLDPAPELLTDPSFSMETAQGSRKTSVLIWVGSMPGPRQNEPVSLSKRLTLTSQSSMVMAWRCLLELGPEQAGFIPQANRPFISPWPILWKTDCQ